jgi:acetylserotonin N-methyltransferase
MGEYAWLDGPSCDDRGMWDLWGSVLHWPVVAAADEVGVFAGLDRTPATATEVADGLKLMRRTTVAALGVLSGLGLLVQHQGLYHITEQARMFLLPKSPYYWGDMLRFSRAHPVYFRVVKALRGADGTLTATLTSEWLAKSLDGKRAEIFTRAMHSHSFAAAMGLARRGDLAGVRRMLDVGGGSGSYCIALALRYARMQFAILELPAVCGVTRRYVKEYGLEDRIDILPVDMFADPWPSGSDAILFADIFHAWDWERCLYLGHQCFKVLPSGGKVLAHEILLADTKDSPLASALISMVMALDTEGRQFTAEEMTRLLIDCGFVDIKITPTYGYYSLVSATKP